MQSKKIVRGGDSVPSQSEVCFVFGFIYRALINICGYQDLNLNSAGALFDDDQDVSYVRHGPSTNVASERHVAEKSKVSNPIHNQVSTSDCASEVFKARAGHS